MDTRLAMLSERVATFLARNHLTEVECQLLYVVGTVELPTNKLIQFAIQEHLLARFFSKPTRRRYLSALKSLLRKRLIQRITPATLRRIARFLLADRAVGPIEGFPQVGHIDFTSNGALLFMHLCSILEPDHGNVGYASCVQISPGCLLAIGTSEADVDGAIQGFPSNMSSIRGDPLISIAAWRDRWWRKHTHGVLRTALTCPFN
jgi:hypothetical protein